MNNIDLLKNNLYKISYDQRVSFKNDFYNKLKVINNPEKDNIFKRISNTIIEVNDFTFKAFEQNNIIKDLNINVKVNETNKFILVFNDELEARYFYNIMNNCFGLLS